MWQAEDREWFFDPAELLASLGQAIIATDLEGVVVYWNGGAERLYGWTADEALGRNIGTLTVPAVPRDRPRIMAALRQGISWSGGFPCAPGRHRFPALVTDSGLP